MSRPVVRILVTGAGGLVGQCTVKVASARHDVRAMDHAALDVTDESAVARAFREFPPHAVLHCAAYTDVDGAEREPERALAVNRDGARRVAEAARQQNASVIYVSTDYVFDGTGTEPYREEAETRPLSAYGTSKLEGERAVANACPDGFVVVRSAWLYGAGKGFVDWARARLEKGDTVPVIEDQRGSPTRADDLAAALVRLAEERARGIFHFVNRGEATWLDVGRVVAEELGHDVNRLTPIRAATLARPAVRPAYSVLSVERYQNVTGDEVRPWRDALKDYLRTADGR